MLWNSSFLHVTPLSELQNILAIIIKIVSAFVLSGPGFHGKHFSVWGMFYTGDSNCILEKSFWVVFLYILVAFIMSPTHSFLLIL